MKQTYNIIGDIHGSDSWKQLVQDDAINVFVGDYLDPKVEMHDLPDPTRADSQQPCENSFITANITNFLEIIRYKQAHPETILLLGNHDLHYLIDERYSDYNEMFAPLYYQLLQTFAPLFCGIAYSINNQVLVSHAGVTADWWHKHVSDKVQPMPDEVAEHINRLVFCKKNGITCWDTHQLHMAFSAKQTLRKDDPCGESPTASPLWVRPLSVCQHNLFALNPDIIQVVGHTPQEEIGTMLGIVFIDCQCSDKPQSLTIETEVPNHDGPRFDIRLPRTAGQL